MQGVRTLLHLSELDSPAKQANLDKELSPIVAEATRCLANVCLLQEPARLRLAAQPKIAEAILERGEVRLCSFGVCCRSAQSLHIGPVYADDSFPRGKTAVLVHGVRRFHCPDAGRGHAHSQLSIGQTRRVHQALGFFQCGCLHYGRQHRDRPPQDSLQRQPILSSSSQGGTKQLACASCCQRWQRIAKAGLEKIELWLQYEIGLAE